MLYYLDAVVDDPTRMNATLRNNPFPVDRLSGANVPPLAIRTLFLKKYQFASNDRQPAATATISGIVIPVRWNETGTVVTIAIATYNEMRFIVDDTPAASRLMALLRMKVTVDGSTRLSGNDRFITVDAFRIDAADDLGADAGNP